jgi:hypothetical protein
MAFGKLFKESKFWRTSWDILKLYYNMCNAVQATFFAAFYLVF